MLTATTILVEIVTADGTAAWADPVINPRYRRRQYQATPPAVFADHQAAPIVVSIRHDGPVVGCLDYLEERCGYGNGGLYGVGVVEGVSADVIDGLVQCSPEISANALATIVDDDRWSMFGRRSRTAEVVGAVHATTAELVAVALVDRTAGVTATKVRAWPGDYRDPLDRGRWNRRTVPTIVDRAAAAAGVNLRWRHPATVKINRPAPEPSYEAPSDPRGEVRHSTPYMGVLSVR